MNLCVDCRFCVAQALGVGRALVVSCHADWSVSATSPVTGEVVRRGSGMRECAEIRGAQGLFSKNCDKWEPASKERARLMRELLLTRDGYRFESKSPDTIVVWNGVAGIDERLQEAGERTEPHYPGGVDNDEWAVKYWEADGMHHIATRDRHWLDSDKDKVAWEAEGVIDRSMTSKPLFWAWVRIFRMIRDGKLPTCSDKDAWEWHKVNAWAAVGANLLDGVCTFRIRDMTIRTPGEGYGR